MNGAIHLVVSPPQLPIDPPEDPALIRCDVMHVGPMAVIILAANTDQMETRAMIEEAFARLLPPAKPAALEKEA